jgi:putative PIN family toxin of toxin-antitoxin system
VSASPPRVVLDTNIVLSALVFGGGAAGVVRHAWQNGVITPLVSTATARELLRVLAYPRFRLSEIDQESLLADYLPQAQVVHVPDPPPVVPDCRDPADLPFLHLAAAGRARWLVSGDGDLLSLADRFRRRPACHIVTLAAFIETLRLSAH